MLRMCTALTLVIASLATTAGAASTEGNPFHVRTMAGHRWQFPHKMSHLTRYRIIRYHDLFIINHKRYYPAHVVAHHRRELRHAVAHINRILHPPFSYPWWWVPLGICETGVNPPDPAYGAPGHPGGDGYEGWINFDPSTWVSYGGLRYGAHAYDATEYEQYLVTMAMHNSGVPWSQSNPACSARIGM